VKKTVLEIISKYPDTVFWTVYIMSVYIYTAYLVNKEKKTGEKNWWILRGIQFRKKTM
jgi:hypothetical protein